MKKKKQTNKTETKDTSIDTETCCVIRFLTK